MKKTKITILIFTGLAFIFIFFVKNNGDPELGKKIYEEGILSNGTLLTATTEGGGQLSGEIISCARCHRKSGFGSFEGNIYVPPITANILFKDEVHKRFKYVVEALPEKPAHILLYFTMFFDFKVLSLINY